LITAEYYATLIFAFIIAIAIAADSRFHTPFSLQLSFPRHYASRHYATPLLISRQPLFSPRLPHITHAIDFHFIARC